MLRNWLVSKERALQARLESAQGEEGFTLIEMSIVLVIIGLLIGGVLKGQELIESTRLKSVVTQWDAIRAAVNGFQDRYNAMPGDYDQANTTIRTNGVRLGNGNGIIGAAAADGGVVAYTANTIADENLGAWSHLGAANLVSGITVGVTANTAQAANQGGIMPGRIANSFYTFIEGWDQAQYGLWTRFQLGGTTAAPAGDPLSPKQTAEIERKYDDGSALAGTIHASNEGGAACATAVTGAYNALNAAKTCTLLMGLQ